MTRAGILLLLVLCWCCAADRRIGKRRQQTTYKEEDAPSTLWQDLKGVVGDHVQKGVQELITSKAFGRDTEIEDQEGEWAGPDGGAATKPNRVNYYPYGYYRHHPDEDDPEHHVYYGSNGAYVWVFWLLLIGVIILIGICIFSSAYRVSSYLIDLVILLIVVGGFLWLLFLIVSHPHDHSHNGHGGEHSHNGHEE